MAYLMVHLKIAQELLKNNTNIKDIGAFYKGSLAPDAIMFRHGCKRSEKSSTHFCVGDEGWGNYTNYDEWENNLNLSIRNYIGKINSSFLFGYYVHVLTDIATANMFWNPVRLTNDRKYMDDYSKDCAEIDSRLLESFENKEMLWSQLKNSTDYCLSDLFNVNDLSILIDEMTNNMYNNRKSNPDYEFKVITFSDMLDFINIMVSKISNVQFRV
jgi:hypothetical protein